ncbi:MAG: hypothetical protein Q8R13_01340 [bacterium]|nr:hypothetical protein [bacterium]MDZ4296678.1 hypothetical protein [Patescibacteria group bacterium]
MGSYHTRTVEEFKARNGYVIDEHWFPRVTAICDIKSKPALYRFYGNVANFAEGSRIKERSASEGTMVHSAIEAVLKGDAGAVPLGVVPAVEAFYRFQKDHEFVTHPAMIERRLLHPDERYAGTIDILAKVDGRVGVLDIKTSLSIWRDYNLQTSAYLYAIRCGGLIDVPVRQLPETRWILRLDQWRRCEHCGAKMRSKGGYDTIRGADADCSHQWGPVIGEYEFKELGDAEGDFRAFIAAKILWEWENERLLQKIGYLQ